MCNGTNNQNKLILKYPASWWGNMWREALPSGNGRIGAAVYGGVKYETILINHGDLWHWGKKDTLPDLSHLLPQTRKLMDGGNYQEASWLLTKALKDSGYSTKLASPLPLADLKVEMPCDKGFKHYRRYLDMETGEVTVQWKEDTALYKRSLFVSRSDNAVIYEISCQGSLINASFSLSMHDGEDNGTKTKAEQIKDSLEIIAQDNLIFYAARNDDGTDYGAVLKVIPHKGSMTADKNTIHIQNSDKIIAILKVFVKGERNLDWERLTQELSSLAADYNKLLEAHVNVHKPLFNSASIKLGDSETELSNEELLLQAYDGEAPASLIQKMWAYGRYLFISATTPDGRPCNMYGLWGGGYRLVWCHYMANENIQMMHWHAAVGGLSALMTAFFNHYDSLMGDFKENARKLYGCRGIYAPAGSTPDIGVPNQIVPVIMNWTSAAGWLANHYYEYYLFTGDTEHLKNKALPFMREVALFYEDFAVMGDDGYYKYYPSVSPENTPGNYYPEDIEHMDHPMPTTINATMDFAIMKELLGNLISSCNITGLYIEDCRKWQEMLSHIPPYQINEDGAVKEWMHPAFADRYDHRHLSHIYPVFPGHEITSENNPELFNAFDTAVNKRLLGAQTAWSLTHMACIYARLGYGDKALECLDLLSRSCLLNNFYTLHNDWRNMGVCLVRSSAPIQMDANMGWVAAVQEMLLYSSADIIKVLPACPAKWTKGEVKDLRFCTGRISFKWDKDNDIFEANIMAERDTDITLKLPQVCISYTGTDKGVVIEPSALGENCVRLSMPAGSSISFR